MLQELEDIKEKYRQLTHSLSDPALISDPQKIKKIAKERADLEPLVKKYEVYEKVTKDIKESKEILADPDSERYCFFQRTPMMRRMSCWRSELAQVVMKHPFSLRIYSGCIRGIQK